MQIECILLFWIYIFIYKAYYTDFHWPWSISFLWFLQAFIEVSQRKQTLGGRRQWIVEVVIQWFQDRNGLWSHANHFLLCKTTYGSQGCHSNRSSHLVCHRVELVIEQQSALNNQASKPIYDIPDWWLTREYFALYLLARVLQDLDAVLDEFREIGLLNFTMVLWCRIVHDHQLPQDTQIQLCPLHITQLYQRTTTKKTPAQVQVRASHKGRLC